MRVVVTGATGTIGSALVALLRRRGDTPVALSRDPQGARATLGADVEIHGWPHPEAEPPPVQALAGAGAVVHLLGEPVSQRWTKGAKARIRESRVFATRQLVAALAALPDDDRPTVLVSQSATGYYGPRGPEPIGEDGPPGADFLACVVFAWEREACAAQHFMRVVVARTGVVLSPTGGALAKMLPFFRAGVGGPVAGGRQHVPWVHIDDAVAALALCVTDDRARGPVNVVAPAATTNADLSTALGRVLRRPAFAPVPALALRALYGEMAQIVTTGQNVTPARLLELGFEFAHPEIEDALRDALGRAAMR